MTVRARAEEKLQRLLLDVDGIRERRRKGRRTELGGFTMSEEQPMEAEEGASLAVTPVSPGEFGRAGCAAWKLRAWDDPVVQQAFLDRSLIAVSADELGDLSRNPSDDDLRAALRSSAPGRSERAIGTFVRYWRSFLTDMSVDDVVVVPLAHRRAAIGVITGGPRYADAEPDPRLRHTRTVRWVAVVLRADLDDDLRRVINSPGTVGQIRAADAAGRLLAAASLDC
jgi:hypothetical protein